MAAGRKQTLQTWAVIPYLDSKFVRNCDRLYLNEKMQEDMKIRNEESKTLSTCGSKPVSDGKPQRRTLAERFAEYAGPGWKEAFGEEMKEWENLPLTGKEIIE